MTTVNLAYFLRMSRLSPAGLAKQLVPDGEPFTRQNVEYWLKTGNAYVDLDVKTDTVNRIYIAREKDVYRQLGGKAE